VVRERQPPSRRELLRLRRGDLDPDAVAALAERAVGLSAPAAPPEGDLAPNGVGWVIGAGDLQQQVYPDLANRARWLPLFLPFALAVLGEISPSQGVYRSALIASCAVAWVGLRAPWNRAKRQLRRASRVTRLDDVPDGSLVRVVGVIRPQATVPTLFAGVPAVLSRSRMGPAQETRGVDFVLELETGEQAKVAVRRSFLLDRPQRRREPPACGPVTTDTVDDVHVLRSDMLRELGLSANSGPISGRSSRRYESSVGPGDRVEVCGVVHHEVSADVVPRSSRQVPTRAVLSAGENIPLLVRRPID
jgi:hypothetical protein